MDSYWHYISEVVQKVHFFGDIWGNYAYLKKLMLELQPLTFFGTILVSNISTKVLKKAAYLMISLHLFGANKVSMQCTF